MQEALIDLIKPSIFDSDARVNQTANSSLWESSVIQFLILQFLNQ